jgi:hypothetical protein
VAFNLDTILSADTLSIVNVSGVLSFTLSMALGNHGGRSMKRKSSLSKDQAMQSAVTEAQTWAKAIVKRESRGAGDLENAMSRLANRHSGVTRSMLWSLLYRPPKDMLVSKYVSLRQAYIAECERQENALRHEREITQAKSLVGKAFVAASDALDSEEG